MQVFKNVWFLLMCFIILSAANILLYENIFSSKKLTVTLFEAGKGTSILVRNPNRHTLLVNTGSDASILRVLGKELPPWQRSVDTILLTSPTTNDVGGFPDVLTRYHVSNVVRTAMQGSPYIETSLASAMDLENIHSITVPFGTRLAFGQGVDITILSSDKVTISYGSSTLEISSTTPLGVYTLNGETVTETK